MVELHVPWYWHCLDCNHLFKLPKATYFSYQKVKTPIYCPACGHSNTEKSFKEYYLFNPEVKKI